MFVKRPSVFLLFFFDTTIIILKMGDMDWIHLAQDKEDREDLTKKIMSLGFHKMRGISLPSEELYCTDLLTTVVEQARMKGRNLRCTWKEMSNIWKASHPAADWIS